VEKLRELEVVLFMMMNDLVLKEERKWPCSHYCCYSSFFLLFFGDFLG
jgi:hypothetical protein